MSICAGLNTMATTAILYRTRLTTDLDISTENIVSYRAYSEDTRLFGELSTVIVGTR
jgi:hypothetical protein